MGKGGCGEVYRGSFRGKLVAVKKLLPKFTQVRKEWYPDAHAAHNHVAVSSSFKLPLLADDSGRLLLLLQ